MRILIDVPTFDGSMAPECVQGLWELDRGGHEVDLHVTFGYGVAMARNRAADHALDGGYDRLLMVDADVALPKDALTNMLEHDADVVMGYYMSRHRGTGEQRTCLYRLSMDWSQRFTPDQLRALRTSGTNSLKVMGGGMGCCLIRPSVFHRIAFPWFEWVDRERHGKSKGEDIDFCVKCQQMGIDIIADTRVACGHVVREVAWAD